MYKIKFHVVKARDCVEQRWLFVMVTSNIANKLPAIVVTFTTTIYLDVYKDLYVNVSVNSFSVDVSIHSKLFLLLEMFVGTDMCPIRGKFIHSSQLIEKKKYKAYCFLEAST